MVLKLLNTRDQRFSLLQGPYSKSILNMLKQTRPQGKIPPGTRSKIKDCFNILVNLRSNEFPGATKASLLFPASALVLKVVQILTRR